MKRKGWILVLGLCVFPIIAVSTLAQITFERTYGGSFDDRGISVQQTSDGGYILGGYTISFGVGGSDVYLIKTDSLGYTLWTRTYGGTGNDYGLSVQQTSDRGYILGGYTYSFGAGMSDVYLIKTNPSGDTLWTRTYGGFSDDLGYAVQQTSDGGYILGGFTKSFGAGEYDFYLIKTDCNGMVVGIEEEGSVFKVQGPWVKLFQNHPNPFHYFTVIRYNIPSTNHSPQAENTNYVTLAVYDLTGRLVETLIYEFQEPGVYQVEWEAKDQSSGIYFYRLSTGNTTLTKKMILLK